MPHPTTSVLRTLDWQFLATQQHSRVTIFKTMILQLLCWVDLLPTQPTVLANLSQWNT